jgi:ankyrin repeat protein
VNARSGIGLTALMPAASWGHSDIVAALLAKGAQVNLQDQEGRTALIWAAFGDGGTKDSRVAVVKLLLANGADVNLRNSAGKTALMIARDKARLEIVQLLQKARDEK